MTIPHPETIQGPTWFTETQVWAEKPGMNHTDNPIIWEILRGSGMGSKVSQIFIIPQSLYRSSTPAWDTSGVNVFSFNLFNLYFLWEKLSWFSENSLTLGRGALGWDLPSATCLQCDREEISEPSLFLYKSVDRWLLMIPSTLIFCESKMVLITHCKALESYIIKASFIKILSAFQVKQLKINKKTWGFSGNMDIREFTLDETNTKIKKKLNAA